MTTPIQIPSRNDAILRHKETGGTIAAVFPVHYHRALLRAFGMLPVEVWGPPGRDTTQGDSHLQAYTCSIVRCGLSFVLDGGLDKADALVVPHACDSLQGFASVLLDFVGGQTKVLPLYIPRGRRESDARFLANELKAMYEKLAEATGQRPSDEELVACIAREERADAALSGLLAARPNLSMTNRAFYEVVRSREYLPAEDFEPLASLTATQTRSPVKDGARVVLSGLVPEPMGVLDALDEAGIIVAADDLACSGRRTYPASDSQDPFLRMAQSIQAGPPDSTRGCPVNARLAHLLTLARRSEARGVLYFDIKFCEPELFYLPQLNRGLKNAGIRTLQVEVDIADPLPDQVVTRLEAFAETLS